MSKVEKDREEYKKYEQETKLKGKETVRVGKLRERPEYVFGVKVSKFYKRLLKPT